MWRIVWRQAALNELTAGWLQADSPLRQAITAASHQIDQRLSQNPSQEGESRGKGTRVTFVPPLAVTFKVEEDARVVRVVHVRVFKPRNR